MKNLISTFHHSLLVLLFGINPGFAQIKGFDYQPATERILTYDQYSIKMWNSETMEKLDDRPLIREEDNRNKDPMTIARAGFIDKQFIYVLLYRSGGGGNQLRYLIADGLSNEILLEDFQKEYSTHVSFTALHPQTSNKTIILKDEGSRNDIYEMHLNTAFAQLVHKGKEGENEFVYRIYDAMVDDQYLVYSDKISDEIWIHPVDDYDSTTVLTYDEYPHQELFLQNKMLIFILDNNVKVYDITEKNKLTEFSLGEGDYLERAWIIDTERMLLINDIGDAIQVNITDGAEINRMSLGEELYIRSFKVKNNNLLLLDDNNRLIEFNPENLETISITDLSND